MSKFLNQPFGVLWRSSLVRLPRLVPDAILHYTSPEGPHPFVISLPSRGNYQIPVYVFLPTCIPEDKEEGLPIVIDFHGGGFYLGSCLEQAPFCAQMCRELGAVVMSVDYRMGPVDKFPAAIEDGEDVLAAVVDQNKPGFWVLREALAARLEKPSKKQGEERCINLDVSRIALSGFSSGGNLALNLALSIPEAPPLVPKTWPSVFPTDHPHPIALLLFYPSFDSRQLPSERTRPPNLPMTKSFWGDVSEALVPTYLPRDQSGHPRASPGLADTGNGGLHHQAKMLLVLPELDTLAEQSEVWVKKVESEGRSSDLTVERYPGMKHGWTQMPESWLLEDEKRTRVESFRHAVEFVLQTWDAQQAS